MQTTVGEARSAAQRLLEAAGMHEDAARRTAWALVMAEVWEKRSHGLLRLPFYLQRFAAGGANPRAEVRLVADSGPLVSYDGGNGLGHAQLWGACEEAAARARLYGIGGAAVGRSGHCGVLGLYTLPALDSGLAALVFSNGPAVMPPWGGHRPVLSTSPLAAGLPTRPRPIVVDLATSTVARGRIAEAAAAGERLPAGWAFDSEGHPTDDPAAALAGMLAPMGGAKGFALALVVEALTGGMIGPHLATRVADPLSPAKAAEEQAISHLVLVVDPERLDVDGRWRERLEELAASVIASGGRLPGAGHPLPDEVAGDDPLRLDDQLAARLGAHGRELGTQLPAGFVAG
ncbi:MAG TPA: Ldh family oxidoreductase [Acidimicrobiales bacterium]|nr:Ldh family oxidoreductase [Acidimicrobiales bacterium]